ncbi:MAG: L-seryl-tRNA(Sec) selenium transferase [Desulfuromonas sp.]|nr:MAG: L-seryl-tRNA(Sec) selenium transferase [Desulfuromonas sp.]
MNDPNSLLRALPSVDRLLQAPALARLADELPHIYLLEAAQHAVASCRTALLSGETLDQQELSVDGVAQRAAESALRATQPKLRKVINATGTLLHTNLGRAPLAASALDAVTSISRSYSNLELDLDSGKRGHRYSHIEELLCRLTGAEAATAVNNNAGAVLLCLTAMARGQEAIVSRGELVEIGGAFRVPDVMEAGGVRLREVGTTNKTHPHDYQNAIGDETGLLLKIHTSNYRIVGFTEDVSSSQLVEIGREHQLPVMEDLGSGMLLDMTPFGLPREPTVAEAVASGLDIVTFSGDKLLGGPQAGLIVGKRKAIETIRKHPMARALRIDKMTLAALEATLRLYLEPQKALDEIPVLRMLDISAPELLKRSRALARKLRSVCGEKARIEVVAESSCVGGGALPLTELPGSAVAVTPTGMSVDTLAEQLRSRQPAVIGRIQSEQLMLNPRTLRKDEETLLVSALQQAIQP